MEVGNVVKIVWKKHGNSMEVGNNIEIIWMEIRWKLEIS